MKKTFEAALFHDVNSASKAIDMLLRRGTERERLGLLLPDRDVRTGRSSVPPRRLGGNDTERGDALGAAAAAMAASGKSVNCSGIELVVAGAIAESFAQCRPESADDEATARASLHRALRDAGVPSHLVHAYGLALREGAVLVAIEVSGVSEDELVSSREALTSAGAIKMRA